MFGVILLIIAAVLGVAGVLVPSNVCLIIAAVALIIGLIALGVQPGDLIDDIFD